MRRIISDVSRWACFLHRVNRDLPLAGFDDSPTLRFSDELFARLHGDGDELLPEGEQDPDWRDWARAIHEAAAALPMFERLADQCRGDPDAAAIAVETVLDELGSQDGAREVEPTEARKALRSGVARACKEIDEVKEAAEGLEFVAPGDRPDGSHGHSPDRETVAGLGRRLRRDPAFKRIAVMAGRFRRILLGKKRSVVREGCEDVADVVLGGDIAKLLASSLAGLLHPTRRLATLAAIVERRALQYDLLGREALGKGPMLVLLDRSSSMAEGGKNPWALAAVLSLAALAKEERRTFVLLGFTETVGNEVIVRHGELLPQGALQWGCEGGTDISAAIDRALEVRAQHPNLERSDIVLVSDGASDPSRAPELRERAHAAGVVILGLAVEVASADLSPWCDHIEPVGPLDTLSDNVADALIGSV